MRQLSDKLYSAVRALAGEGPVKARLASAYEENLEILPEEDIPASIRPRFERLRQAMHAVKPTNVESPVTASVRKMSSAEATRHANQIVAMYSELTQVKATDKRARIIATTESESVAVIRTPDRATLN
jgi:hypothetical protein